MVKFLLLFLLLINDVSHAQTLNDSQSKKDHKNKIALQLAKTYKSSNIDLADYWVSEKYDGVRAYWNGSDMFTRGGYIINLPKTYKKVLPNLPLDGELWSGRQNFEFVNGLARQHKPQLHNWKKVQFMVFDLPKNKSPFEKRYADLLYLHTQSGNQNFWSVVKQKPIKNEKQLFDLLKKIEALKGEGLILKNKHSLYTQGRSDDLIKVKSYVTIQQKNT